MEEVTVEIMLLEERQFLHDLSNKLVIAQGMANIVLSKLKKEDNVDEAIIDKQVKAVTALNDQVTLLKERRSILHSRS